MQLCDIGLIGLAVMGQNLVRNMARHGYRVAVYNRTYAKTEAFLAGPARGEDIHSAATLPELVAMVKKPRRIMLMVQAGAPVDAMIDALIPLMEPGDVIVDGGNSFFKDTIRRAAKVEGAGLNYLGAGVSGGEEGALNGPSIMPGGTRRAWEMMGPVLRDISAKVAGGAPCCDYVGADGAGHYVKMTHNGIEYGDMQLISEAYFLMRELLGMAPAEMAEVFAQWNQGELDSYLIEITADILGRTDPQTGRPLVDVILDAAGQKGTGKWTSQEALELGVAAPTVAEAVFARCMSANKAGRVAAAPALAGPKRAFTGDRQAFIADIGRALYASKICSYAQGFDLMHQAAAQYGWDLRYGDIALLWRGGCIIRAQFLGRIKQAYDRDPDLANLLLDPYFTEVTAQAQDSWRNVVAQAALCGVAAPCFSSALSYYDAFRTANLPANLIQAQRDYFGAHTYRRVDMDGVFHTQWLE
ncbi:MAG: NADP-dependent phosphogluconate dehydrogenase [Christensenellales bacterium]|jgi:6-phosphogluconate dehydrogenase